LTGGEKLDALRLTFYTSPVTLGLLAPVSLSMEWDRMIERLGLPVPPGEKVGLPPLPGDVRLVTWIVLQYWLSSIGPCFDAQ
jgi:hypothetical protein